MKGSVIIPLSREEEDTMRLIALGTSNTEHLRTGDVDQLAKLRLAEEENGKVTLTGLGRLRLAQSQERVFQAIPMPLVLASSAFTDRRGLTQR